ncbi:uncharacterized protein, partial [Pyrus communis]|uniref:uncharacterized protein n=1 Tax=Pyrus communis TaxID=23211 RepID=UPI0035C08152
MEDGKVPMSWGTKVKTNQGMIHTQIHTIRDGEITQISSGGSLNNLNNKEEFDSHPQGYIRGHLHNLNLNHKLPNKTQGLQNQNNRIANQEKEMSDVKKQIGQISEFLRQFREQGKLPSSTIVNPKGSFETAKAITLRSGKELGSHPKPSEQGLNEEEKLLQEEEHGVKATAREAKTLPQPSSAPKPSQATKKEIIKLLDCGVIYPISDSRWVSPVQVVPKKSGVTVIKNDENELVPTRIQTGWRVCIDYRKLNAMTRKDHFPLPFIDQMLERLAGHAFYCFLDGYSGYNQIVIAPDDQEKTTFTCPFGTFAFRRMPFGLCNAPATFQRCMVSIFSDFVEKIIEVFMDDFSVFGSSFDNCLDNLTLILKRCAETNLVLNWEKCHFMVKQGIVLGHIVSEKGIEVDKSKIDLVRHLPSPTSVREVRSFLGHAGFYRRFIKDFSKEIIKLLDCGVIYPISDSRWVSPVQVVPKKSGVTVIKNDENELVPTRIQTGWRVCIDYRKLNAMTRKDHFPLPFIDQMLERLAGHAFYCFLDGYSGYNQIVIAPDDQEKTTFTCPFGTFAFRRMPFGLCNAPATFQRCMVSIFSDFVEKIIEVFMDDFSVFGSSFDNCLDNLTLILKRCAETNLVLNWEKCHFMVKQGIVLGHIVSEKGIEVDKSKIDLVRHLPSPTSVREVRSFLGHAGFYRRFIKDFS